MARSIAKDHDQKRLNILTAAADVFAQEGIARASMAEVAKRCGISKANIYHYYASKDALLFDILDSYLSKLRDRIVDLPLQELSSEQKLHRILQEFLFAYEGMDSEHKIQTEGLPLLDTEAQTILKNYQREMVSLVETVLADLLPPNGAKNNAQLRDITMSVFGMLNWFYVWNRKADQSVRERYAHTIAELTLNGVKAFEMKPET